MGNKLAVSAVGLIVAAALGIPAGAQAAVSHSGSAYAKAAAATPDVPPPVDGCGYTMNDRGNGKYATDSVDPNWLYFEPLANPNSPPSSFVYCNFTVSSEGTFEIWDPNTGRCLAPNLNTTDDEIGEDTTTACGDTLNDPAINPWDQWLAVNVGTYHGQNVWVFDNQDTGTCLYDDAQEPAILSRFSLAGCDRADSFEQFVWDALP